jgi:hypothetical protein
MPSLQQPRDQLQRRERKLHRLPVAAPRKIKEREAVVDFALSL